MQHKQMQAVDRLPILCAAGRKPKRSEPLGELLRIYPQEHLAEKLVKEREHLVSRPPVEKSTPVIPEQNQLRDVLAPDLNKSRFLEFKDRFYENLYCKKVDLGKPTPTNSKPDTVTNESVTFGKVLPKQESVYDITLPKRKYEDVLKDYVKWHDKYIISHHDYFPSEQIKRKYNKNFNPDRMFGIMYNVDVSGKLVKSILQNFEVTSKLHIINKTQQEYLARYKSPLGKPTYKQTAPLSEDSSRMYGRIATTDEYHIKDLLTSNLKPADITKFANVSTYRAFASDLYCAPVECRGAAGTIEDKYPRKRECKFYGENLGEETTAKHLISPSIPMHFGLSHRDFLLPRPKEQIRRIFTKAGHDLSDDEFFEKVWAIAVSEWTSAGDKASVEAFKYALQKIATENEKKATAT